MTVKILGNNNFCPDKSWNCNKMMLSKNDQIRPDETASTDTINKHFVNMTKDLKLRPTGTETN